MGRVNMNGLQVAWNGCRLCEKGCSLCEERRVYFYEEERVADRVQSRRLVSCASIGLLIFCYVGDFKFDKHPPPRDGVSTLLTCSIYPL